MKLKKHDPKVEKVYKLVHKTTGALGGNGYNGAIYGELTCASFQDVLNILIDKCDLCPSSRIIDVGAGLGKPNFHAAQFPGVRLSLGVELEEIRWQLSMLNLKRVLEDEAPPRLLGGVNFIESDIDLASSMDPFTHVYMYDLGFPPELQKSIAQKFNNSEHCEYLISYRPPRRVISEYGYSVEHVDKTITSMHGSGEGHTAYIYKRINKPQRLPKLSNQVRLVIPPRNSSECEESVQCDKLFYSAALLAVKLDKSDLKAFVEGVVTAYMNRERPKRTIKPALKSLL